ncbi:MAG: glycosyltransferase family 2 protein [Candidatus Omnitrophica bacterium]|nr:glycosyltransferase family 2 protein [Candidatus Omnitrophota bacterium]
MANTSVAPQFSIVIPVLNEKENILPLYEEILEVMKRESWSFEIIFINDGSTDGTSDTLNSLIQIDARVRVFSFRKIYGKSAAMDCGFKHAQGRYVVTLDGDLQDDPKEIPRLRTALQTKNADLVSGWKKERHDPLSKIISSRLFNPLVAFLTGVRLHDFNCGLKLYRSEVVKELSLYGELHRFIPALASWKGFHVTEEPVHHRPRKHGRSKYGVTRAFAGMVDLLTVIFLMRYEGKPAHLFSGFGFFLTLIGVFINGHLLATKLLGGIIAPHYPYLMLGILSLIVGIQCVFFGLLAEMMVHLSRTREMAFRFRVEREDENP